MGICKYCGERINNLDHHETVHERELNRFYAMVEKDLADFDEFFHDPYDSQHIVETEVGGAR